MTPNAYTVTVNIPGYLPMDDEPPVFTSRREAERYAVEEAARIIDSSYDSDDPDDIYHKSGSARDGFIHLETRRPHDLGLNVAVHQLEPDQAREALEAQEARG